MYLDELIEKAKKARCRFFDEGAVKGFNSRAYDPVTEHGLFISSEKMDSQRRYTVRRFVEFNDGTATVRSESEFMAYPTLGQARTAMKHFEAELVKKDALDNGSKL